MKHQGNTIQHTPRRDSELRRLFSELYTAGHNPTLPDFYRRMVKSPASRFWVSEDRATEVIAKMLKGENISRMYREKQRMYREIYSRAIEKIRRDSRRPLTHIVFEIVNSPAPEFYMSPYTAEKIINRLRRQK